jgi:hypothetical protein
MATQTEKDERKDRPGQGIKVEVRFPISTKGSFTGTFVADTPIKSVRMRAMAFFGIAEDGQHAYYLTYKGKRIEDGTQLGEIDKKAKEIKLTLVKELIQG